MGDDSGRDDNSDDDRKKPMQIMVNIADSHIYYNPCSRKVTVFFFFFTFSIPCIVVQLGYRSVH